MAQGINSFSVRQKRFLDFSYHILRGKNGAFFSVQKGGHDHVVAQYGDQFVSLSEEDEQGRDVFHVYDYKGKKELHGYFESKGDILSDTQRKVALDQIEAIPLINESLEMAVQKDQTSFEQSVQAAQEAQRQGEMWVCNLTHPLCGKQSNHLVLLRVFWNFLSSGNDHVGGVFMSKELNFCSMSPELFLSVENDILQTSPIKGTGTNKEALLESEKEIAELSMVTDLLRNDIGMIAEKVWVENERRITHHGSFYHAQADIFGRLDVQGLTRDRMKTLLPAGSITGCPKKRVCEYIDRLEGYNRDWYTGVFGVSTADDRTWYNILIRTLFFGEGDWSFPVGGGITHMSDASMEWEESLLKADSLVRYGFEAV